MFDDHYFIDRRQHHTHVKVEQAGLHDATKNYKEFRDDAEREAAKLELAKFGAENCVRYLRFDKVKSFDTGATRTLLVYEVNGTVHRLEKVFNEEGGTREEERRHIAMSVAAVIVDQLLREVKL